MTKSATINTKEVKGGLDMEQTLNEVKARLACATIIGPDYAGRCYRTTKSLTIKGIKCTWKGIKQVIEKINKKAALIGLGSALLAGAATCTMGAAVVVGASVAATSMVAMELLMNKKRKEEEKKSFMAIALAAIEAAGWAALAPYALTYGLVYVARCFDLVWYIVAKAAVDLAVLFMA